MDARTAWVLGLLSMLAVLLYVYRHTRDLRLAFMASLLWGKVLSGAYWLLGLDYTLYTVYYVTENGWRRIGDITAAGALFIVFLLTNLTIYYWPRITEELTGAAQELPGLPPRRR